MCVYVSVPNERGRSVSTEMVNSRLRTAARRPAKKPAEPIIANDNAIALAA